MIAKVSPGFVTSHAKCLFRSLKPTPTGEHFTVHWFPHNKEINVTYVVKVVFVVFGGLGQGLGRGVGFQESCRGDWVLIYNGVWFGGLGKVMIPHSVL